MPRAAGEDRHVSHAQAGGIACLLAAALLGLMPAAASPARSAPAKAPAASAAGELGRAEMAELQRRLRALGFYRGGVDGLSGPGTEQAIRAFETARGLPESGRPTAVLLATVRADAVGGQAALAQRPAAGPRSTGRSLPKGTFQASGPAAVIDGDTLEINGAWVRLYGIDAPAAEQTCEADSQPYRCGQQAALALKYRVDGRKVSCAERAKDEDLLVLAVCTVYGEDLNAWMVRQGWAVAANGADGYAALEQEARDARRGLWQGAFVRPAEWRSEHQSVPRPTPPAPTGTDEAPAPGLVAGPDAP